MAEMSPLRRRMIEDMRSAICRRRRNDPTFMPSPSSAVISLARRIALVWRMSGPSKSIWSRPGSRGLG
jgi:hypothetical protein